ncbi:hypothetical protein PIB30_071623 [Stylosanthes scabra]|uniref:Uncharacterized protein n=1 Tax=Stylosanthes scabra TaxID=79078 RepID=A0ABU6QPE4_9FABA|nr:hypothetical protein [Stylosanthes scabra]
MHTPTTGPSSGGTDNLKVLDVLDGVFTRSATKFRQKVYQSGLEFEVGVKFRKLVGLVVESCARTTQLFESYSFRHGRGPLAGERNMEPLIYARADKLYRIPAVTGSDLLSPGSQALVPCCRGEPRTVKKLPLC